MPPSGCDTCAPAAEPLEVAEIHSSCSRLFLTIKTYRWHFAYPIKTPDYQQQGHGHPHIDGMCQGVAGQAQIHLPFLPGLLQKLRPMTHTHQNMRTLEGADQAG